MLHMSASSFPAILKKTRQELAQLRKKRAELDDRIAQLEQVEAALRPVAGEKSEPPDLSSITGLVRGVVKSAKEPISPMGVRDQMLAMGFDATRYSQFLASIHVVLRRLAKGNEVFEFTFRDRKTYWWRGRSMPAGPYVENAMLGGYFNSTRLEDLKSPLTYEEAKAKEAAKYRR